MDSELWRCYARLHYIIQLINNTNAVLHIREGCLFEVNHGVDIRYLDNMIVARCTPILNTDVL